MLGIIEGTSNKGGVHVDAIDFLIFCVLSVLLSLTVRSRTSAGNNAGYSL